VGFPSDEQHLGAHIESALTRIELPPEARSVRVCASHSKFPPCAGVELPGLRDVPAGEELGGLVVHEVDVPLVAAHRVPRDPDLLRDRADRCTLSMKLFALKYLTHLDHSSSRVAVGCSPTASPGWARSGSGFTCRVGQVWCTASSFENLLQSLEHLGREMQVVVAVEEPLQWLHPDVALDLPEAARREPPGS
jgi:hypothetical protein